MTSTDLLQQLLLLRWVGPMCLTASEVARVPEGVPGIYMLHTFIPILGAYPPFYVGKTSDIKVRLTQHLDDAQAKLSVRALRRSARAYFSAAPVSEPELLSRIESGLIRVLSPVCNQQVPTARPVFVTLPPMTLF